MVRGDKCRPAPSIPFRRVSYRSAPSRLLQILPRIAALGTGNILRRTGRYHPTAPGSPFGTDVDDVVRRLHHIEIMLYHDDRIAPFHQFVDNLQQLTHVFEMQPRRGFVKDIKGTTRIAFGQFARQLIRWLSPPDSVVHGCPELR